MKLFLCTISMIVIVNVTGKPPDLKPPHPEHQPQATNSPLEPKNFNLASLVATGKSAKSSKPNVLGPPISAEEIAAAMANSSLMKPPPGVDHALENSGEFQGDIILTPDQQAQIKMGVRVANLDRKWENGIIPYTISSVYTTNERLVIARAIAEFEARTCIKFVGRTTEVDYIEIIRDPAGCGSHIGRIGGNQILGIGHGCVSVKILIHEFMHALGIWHEHNRYDRDDYVTIHWENIQDGREGAFSKVSKYGNSDFGLKYDYNSVMHYEALAFSKNRQPTITPKEVGVAIGWKDGFSQLDVLGINLLYECIVSCDADKWRCGSGTECIEVEERCDLIFNCRDKSDEMDCDSCSSFGGQCINFNGDLKSWEQADTSCKVKGWRLAVIQDHVAFNAYMRSNYDGKRFWLGGSDKKEEGTWTWINGQSLAGFPWGPGQPDDYKGNEDCLAWGWNSNYNDELCTSAQRYICEPELPRTSKAPKSTLPPSSITTTKTTTTNSPGCVEGVSIAGQCLLFSTEVLTWNAAKEKCSSQYGRLASLNDPQAFKDYVLSKYNNEWFWLGGSDKANEGSWVWQNGQPLGDQFPWGQDEPNDYEGDEDCLQYVQLGSHIAFNDDACDRQFKYVCEKDPCSSFEGQCINFNEELKSWEQADTSCKAKGQQLAVIQDPVAFNAYMRSNHGGERFWLGGSDRNHEGTWTWINGLLLDSFPWGHDQPDNYNDNENCLEWGYRNNYNDDVCTNAQRYVCEHGNN